MISGRKASFIEIYTMDTTGENIFELSSTYDFGENAMRAGISDDFSTVVYSTLRTQSIGISKATNGTYENVFQDTASSTFLEAISDKDGLYYIFSNFDKIIRIYYSCPT